MFSPTVQNILWSLVAGLVSALWYLMRKQGGMLTEQMRIDENFAQQGLRPLLEDSLKQ